MKIRLSKKTIVILLIILSLIAIGRILKVKGYLPKDFLYQTLVNLHITKPCYNSYKNMIEIFNQEGFDYEESNKKVITDSLNKLLDTNILVADAPKIPPITHRVYLVSKQISNNLNDFYIEEMKVNFNKLNDLGEDWQHNIWTNDSDLFPLEIKDIKGVNIRSVDELKDNPLYRFLLEIIDKGQAKGPYLAEAADLVRLIVTEKFGGIYMDMDYEIYNPDALFDLMKKFDFIGGREKLSQWSLYGNAFIAAKPGHPILKRALEIEFRNRKSGINNTNVPTYIKYPCKEYDSIYFNGPLLMTISYFAENNKNGNSDIILPPWMIFNVQFARLKNAYGFAERSNGLFSAVKRFFTKNKDYNRVCDYSLILPKNFNSSIDFMPQLIQDYIQNVKKEDFAQYYKLQDTTREDLGYRDYEQNIYYNLEDRERFKIIGADMFCGSWTQGKKISGRAYYWNLPKFLMQ